MTFRYQKHCLHAVFLIGLAFALCAADLPGPQFVKENTESVAGNDADIDVLSESLSGPDDVAFDVDTNTQNRGVFDGVRTLWTKTVAHVKSWLTEDEDFKLPGSILASWRDSGCRMRRGPNPMPFSHNPCYDECIVVVSTLEAKVNATTQNGLVDIAAVLQDAVERASTAATRRGFESCTVILPKGQYTITKTISMRSRVHVMATPLPSLFPSAAPTSSLISLHLSL